MTEQSDEPPLGDTWRDKATSLLKGGIGAIAVAGSILAELVDLFIPNQRLDRIEDYLRRLSERLDALDESELRKKATAPESVDLFEEGAMQSTRALSDDRRDYIAKIVADGISGDAKDAAEAKRMLRLLASIDDDQILILTSYLMKNSRDPAFHERHRSLLEPVRFTSARIKKRRIALRCGN